MQVIHDHCGRMPKRREPSVVAPDDQPAASSLVGVTAAIVASRETRSAGRYR
jgi:hypothetical protein